LVGISAYRLELRAVCYRYSPTTKLRTLPSYSMVSPRALHSAHSRREDCNRSLANLNASIAYPEPGRYENICTENAKPCGQTELLTTMTWLLGCCSTRTLGGPDGKSQINLHRSHACVSSDGSTGQSPHRTLVSAHVRIGLCAAYWKHLHDSISRLEPSHKAPCLTRFRLA
jgi:hypothetical protein